MKYKLNKYTGIIQTYYETGLECMDIVFHDDRDNHEGSVLHHPTQTMIYRSLDWTI